MKSIFVAALMTTCTTIFAAFPTTIGSGVWTQTDAASSPPCYTRTVVKGTDTERIRLLILINSLPPYGAENFVLNHVRHHDRRRFSITVAHFRGPDTLAPALREAGAEVVCLEEKRRPSPDALLRLARLLRHRQFDVLQTHVAYAGAVGRVVGRACRVPVVVSTEQAVRFDFSWKWRGAIDATFHLAHANVYITRAVHQSFAARFPSLARREPIVITNGIDTGKIRETAAAARARVRAELGLAEDAFVFGNVGRLHPIKGQRTAIRALAAVRKKRPRAVLVIVGDGELRAELAALAQSEGVADAVKLLGQRLDVHAVLGAFDAYVHPAQTEGLGIAVLEAMAAGLPTVASNVDGLPEFVRHEETGWLVPKDDASALAARMTALLDGDPRARAIAAAGQALVRREHDVRDAVAAYESLYQRLLAAR
jgi:glycosyltransferase involved in cell wall biosynthesis